MIGISFNKKEFEYDAYTLVKAFYPQEEVENFYEEDAEEKKVYDLLVRITYGEDKTHLSLERDGEIIFGEAARFKKGQERKERKNILKQILYRGLVQETGITLPWGNLTGIRPTKIAMGLIESGMSNAEAADYMRRTYYTIIKMGTACMWEVPSAPVSVCIVLSAHLL